MIANGYRFGELRKAQKASHASVRVAGFGTVLSRSARTGGVGFGNKSAEWITKTDGNPRTMGTPDTTAQVTTALGMWTTPVDRYFSEPSVCAFSAGKQNANI